MRRLIRGLQMWRMSNWRRLLPPAGRGVKLLHLLIFASFAHRRLSDRLRPALQLISNNSL